jgi:5-methylcytosine-specific restriction endonuclease McrA
MDYKKSRKKSYYEKNRERVLARVNAKRSTPEAKAALKVKRSAPEYKAARKAYEASPKGESVRKARESTPEHRGAKNHRQAMRKTGCDPVADALAVYVECSERRLADPDPNWEVDHIIPMSQGGSTTADNLQIVPKKWNQSKHDHTQRWNGKDVLFISDAYRDNLKR